jgi:hypothetical protein
VEAFAGEVVKAGVKCIGKGGAPGLDGNWGSSGGNDEEVVRLGSVSVANAVFHSQAAAAAADHEHVNSTAQYWLRLMQAPSPPPPLPRTPPLSNFLLFALQNLAAHSHAAVLISSAIRPSHLLPLFSPLALSDHAMDAASFAAGSHQPSRSFSSHPTRLSQVSSATCCALSLASAPNMPPPPFRRQQAPNPTQSPLPFLLRLLLFAFKLQAIVRRLAAAAAAAGGGDSTEKLEEALLSAVTAFALQVMRSGAHALGFLCFIALDVASPLSVGAALDRLLPPTECRCVMFARVAPCSLPAAGSAEAEAQRWHSVPSSAAKNHAGCRGTAGGRTPLHILPSRAFHSPVNFRPTSFTQCASCRPTPQRVSGQLDARAYCPSSGLPVQLLRWQSVVTVLLLLLPLLLVMMFVRRAREETKTLRNK